MVLRPVAPLAPHSSVGRANQLSPAHALTAATSCTSQEVDEFLAECDTDASGSISFEEFKQLPCWRS